MPKQMYHEWQWVLICVAFLQTLRNFVQLGLRLPAMRMWRSWMICSLLVYHYARQFAWSAAVEVAKLTIFSTGSFIQLLMRDSGFGGMLPCRYTFDQFARVKFSKA
jgi:hypothetical protein